jgi:hypothetical protein
LQEKAERRLCLKNCRKCEALVLEKMSQRLPDEDNSTLSVVNAIVDDFDDRKITVPLLDAFIRCHDPTSGKSRSSRKESANKFRSGESCLIGEAFKLRQEAIALTEDEETEDDTIGHDTAPASNTSECWIKPRALGEHSFLPDKKWYELAQEIFFDDEREPLELSLLQNQAAALSRCLVQRNERWRRNLPKVKETDPLFSHFLPENLPIVAALLISSGLIQDDVSRFEFRSDQCLFKLPSTCDFFRLLVGGCEGAPNDESVIKPIAKTKRGGYLFLNKPSQYWIRSGKASTSYADRYGQHEVASELKRPSDRDSKFYVSYPHKKTNESDLKELVDNRICYFGELDCYMSIGYDTVVDQEAKKKVCSLFRWPKSVRTKLSKKHKGENAKILAEQLVIVDYLLEHCSELCLDPAKDISTNPGWETYLLNF